MPIFWFIDKLTFSYITVAILISLGLYTIIFQKNLIKIVIGLNIIESAIILLLITTGFQAEGTAPILDKSYEVIVDPLPQALALTAIVIGASTTAFMLALVIKLYKRYQTLDLTEIKKLRG